MKETLGKIAYIILIIVFLWVVVSNTIQAFSCSEMTNTQLLLHIPQSFIGDWGCGN